MPDIRLAVYAGYQFGRIRISGGIPDIQLPDTGYPAGYAVNVTDVDLQLRKSKPKKFSKNVLTGYPVHP